MENQEKHINHPDVVERLVKENYNLIYHMINKFVDSGSLKWGDKEEAEWYATDALLKAAQQFDESKGFKFSSLACHCIRNQIFEFIRQKQKCFKMQKKQV